MKKIRRIVQVGTLVLLQFLGSQVILTKHPIDEYDNANEERDPDGDEYAELDVAVIKKLVDYYQSHSHVNRTRRQMLVGGNEEMPLVSSASSYDSSYHGPIFDFVSIGSKSRIDYLQAQRDTFASHVSVRYFVSVTEQDDTETNCSTILTRQDVKEIVNFCVKPSYDHPFRNKHRVLWELRQNFFTWKDFFEPLKQPQGWLCAQKRPNDGLQAILNHYTNTQHASRALIGLPDYLVITDDDTYYNMEAVADYMQQVYNSSEPVIVAGCLIRFYPSRSDHFTCPWGGWGTIISKGVLQNLLRPIYCNDTKHEKISAFNDDFTIGACERLRQDLIGEGQYFRNGMTLRDLIHAYVTTDSYINHRNWKFGYCAHSDWIWGYFFNFYNISHHTGAFEYEHVPHNRIRSYMMSEFHAYETGRRAIEGQCRMTGALCTEDSHTCHRVPPNQMHNLNEYHRRYASHNFRMENKTLSSPLPPLIPQAGARPPVDPQSQYPMPIPVFVFPHDNRTTENELKYFVEDGIRQSRWLESTSDHVNSSVWLVDYRQARLGRKSFCSRFVAYVREAKAAKIHNGELKKWKVIMLYWDENATTDFTGCIRATRIIGSTRIHRYTRSIVVDRRWSNTTAYIEPGRTLQFKNWQDHSGSPIRHISYGVRSDVVNQIEMMLEDEHRIVDQRIQSDSIVNITRSIDIAVFGPSLIRPTTKTILKNSTKLSDIVSLELRKLSKLKPYNIYVDSPGKVSDLGRKASQIAYLRKMLNSKIIVVSQSDQWEDDYRLMEALVSGAMVMTDVMLTLPDGLEDGKSILMYRTLDDLIQKLHYYLHVSPSSRQMIAQQGYQVAMSRHRSWLMMERIVLGAVGIQQF